MDVERKREEEEARRNVTVKDLAAMSTYEYDDEELDQEMMELDGF